MTATQATERPATGAYAVRRFDAWRRPGSGVAGPLDVFETEPLPPASPLRDRDGAVLTPHNAGSTLHLQDRMADLFARSRPVQESTVDDPTNRGG